MKMEGPLQKITLPVVIPANAGIQVYCRPSELAWIPAFAGMTEARKIILINVFSKEAAKGTKVGRRA